MINRDNYKVIEFLGIMIIGTSLLQILSLAPERYFYVFQYLPDSVVTVRYILSWILRILGMACGVGLMLHKNKARQIFLSMCVFTICTVYWKHPLIGFKYNMVYLEKLGIINLGMISSYGFSIDQVAVAAVILAYIFETGFAIFFIYYFTRPQVVKLLS